MNNFKNFKKFWEKEEPEIVTTSNLEETGIYRLLQRPMTFEYDKIDLETIEKVALETFTKINPYDPYHGLGKPFSITFNEPWVPKEKELVKIPGLTWIDMAEKEFIEDFKQKITDTVLMGDYKKEMKMNRVELEMQRLRESTGENYMLNKMINTDGVNFFAEYTLYKDYDKYFGLTLDGESINIIEIMEEEFAEFLYHYRLSAMYPQVEAVHEDTVQEVDGWSTHPEKPAGFDIVNLKEQSIDDYFKNLEAGYILANSEDMKTPMEMLNDSIKIIKDILNNRDKTTDWNITPEENEAIKEQMESGKTDSFVPVYDENDIADELVVDSKYDMTANSFSGTYLKGPEMWTETSTNTGGVHAGMWDSSPSIEGQKEVEDNSKAAFISKIVADVMEELLTKGTCSINITLKQE